MQKIWLQHPAKSMAALLVDSVQSVSHMSVSQSKIRAGGDVTAINIENLSLPQPGVASLHQLPSPPSDFTGRATQHDQLVAALEQGGVAISGVRGMGGIGKTALALVVGAVVKQRFPDGQFYLDLQGTSDQPVTAAQAMLHVIRGFHPDVKDSDDLAQVQGLYHSVLSDKCCLLLMDNAADAQQVASLIPPEGSALLVTSRQKIVLPGIVPIDLDTLPRSEACELLRKIARDLSDKDADALARVCGDLPLALRLAASALVQRPDLSAEQYIERLHDEKKRLDHLPKVEASISLSFDFLDDEDRRPMEMLSVFVGGFTKEAASAVWQSDADASDAFLGRLLGFNLVTWDKQRQRYLLHDMVRLCADRRLEGADRRDAERRHAVHYAQALNAADKLYRSGAEGVLAGLSWLDSERDNVERGFAWVCEHFDDDEATVRLCVAYPNASAHVLRLRLTPLEQIEWLQWQFKAARKAGDRQAEGNALSNLGSAHADLGDARKAMEYGQQRLIIARETGDRSGEGTALGILGNANLSLGDARKAIEYYEQVLTVSRAIDDRRMEGAVLTNLGIAHADIGDTRKEIEYHELALIITCKIGDRLGEGIALGNLGAAYANLGTPRKAIVYYEQALVIARAIGDRSGEALTAWNIGLIYEQEDRLPDAVNVMQICVQFEQEINHPDAEKDAARVEALRQQLKK
jgi:tetratricopeptide (TPR) repeat protein